MSNPFYRTPAWRKLAKCFLESKHYICERCGKPARLVHHKKYITDYNKPEQTLDWNNLEAVCWECHNREHSEKDYRGMLFDANGDIISAKNDNILRVPKKHTEASGGDRAGTQNLLRTATRGGR